MLLSFEDIWKNFEYVIEDMNEGMAFFEGYIIDVSMNGIKSGLQCLLPDPTKITYEFSIWSDDSTKEDWNKTNNSEQYFDFFKSGKIVVLQTEYLTTQNGFELHLKLMIESWDDGGTIEIICYRDPILESASPKLAVKAALSEFMRLKKLFNGGPLFLGPDTLDYPKNGEIYPDFWIKLSN